MDKVNVHVSLLYYASWLEKIRVQLGSKVSIESLYLFLYQFKSNLKYLGWTMQSV